MKNTPLRFALIAFSLLGALSLQAAELATAKVLDVEGTVTVYREGAGNQPLKQGDILREGDSISATALSSADLVFSNGSEVTVEENTSVTMAELQQEPFGGNKSYEQLEADPSQSQTLLELNYGKVSGEVKKLREDSKFHIETPLGTAAIRGTVFFVEIVYDAERGEMILEVHNLGGIVDIISRYIGAIDYNGGNVADKGYDSTASDSKRDSIPDRHIVIIRLPQTDPYYDEIIDDLNDYPPFTDERGRPPVILTIPGPEITDDDGDVQVISPSGP
ncbi:MAG: FecR domain-containing protein, partial [Opitutales bacterium]